MFQMQINELLLEQAPEGPYFLGSEYSIADINIAPFVYRFQLLVNQFLKDDGELQFNEYPRLKQFVQGIVERDSFKATIAPNELLESSFQKFIARIEAAKQ
jgi:glutathione S-transferase